MLADTGPDLAGAHRGFAELSATEDTPPSGVDAPGRRATRVTTPFPGTLRAGPMRSITWKIIVATSASCATMALALGAYMVQLNRARSEAAIELLDRSLREDFDRLARTQVDTAATMLEAVAVLRSRGDLR